MYKYITMYICMHIYVYRIMYHMYVYMHVRIYVIYAYICYMFQMCVSSVNTYCMCIYIHIQCMCNMLAQVQLVNSAGRPRPTWPSFEPWAQNLPRPLAEALVAKDQVEPSKM